MPVTSISDSRRAWIWALVAQACVIGHTVLFTMYLQSGALVFAVLTLFVVGFISYVSLLLARDSGEKWPTGLTSGER